MNHFTSPSFWETFDNLPADIQKLAKKNYKLLKSNPKHPSLHFKKVKNYHSIRIGIRYRAVAVEIEDGLLWFWIGSHNDYDKLIK